MPTWLHRWTWAGDGAPRARSFAPWCGALALMALVLALDPAPFGMVPDEPPAPVLSREQRATQDRCVEGALLVHDVRWAIACSRLAEHGASDGHPECELPPAESDVLHGLLQQAEQACMADAARSGSKWSLLLR